ncbi:unnamed protein product [Bursaphelenchus xylophilus]|uniref:(pine wood nematode) hypothetical protein n=1 Tax=Bursaphelenchus xylophilus TaxID=6326 RepID=A0A1I7RSU4_BURXY|nr:unnamed protein product [Bursaphelenchus xylophilus]CAG9122800.1 unnamed protein product [Bursaphelenchus xylophilus]
MAQKCECCQSTEKVTSKQKGRNVCDDCFYCYVCAKPIKTAKFKVLLDRFYCQGCNVTYTAHRHQLAYMGCGPVCYKLM